MEVALQERGMEVMVQVVDDSGSGGSQEGGGGGSSSGTSFV